MKKCFIALAALMCVSAGFTAASGPANAATPKCQQTGCDGKGPVSQNCDDDAYKIDTVSLRNAWGVAYAQLEFSDHCYAYWARGHSLNTGSDGGVDSAGYTVRVQRAKMSGTIVHTESQHIYSNTGAYDWTLMAGGYYPRKFRACLYMSKAHSGDGKWHCTSWHEAP